MTANVARSEEDAAEQLRKGGAVLGTIDEMEADEALEAAEEVFEEDAVAEEAYEAEGEEEANV